MNKISKAVLLFLGVFFLVNCDGCDPWARVDYTLECSESLLQVATPVIEYKANGENPVVIRPTDKDWTITTKRTTSINGVETTDNILKWTHSGKKYEDFGVVEDEMTVTYELKTGVSEEKKVPDTGLVHQLRASITGEDKDKYSISFNDPIEITQSVSQTVNTDGSSSAPEKKKLADEIKTYKDYRGFTINENGEITEKK